MIKWALIGGLLAALGFSGLNIDSLVYGVIALGIGFMVLAIALEVAVAVLEQVGRRWGGMFHNHGHSVRMQRSRSAS